MDTDWDGTYKGLIRTAEVSWRFVHNDTLECNEICLPHPCVPPGPPPVTPLKSDDDSHEVAACSPQTVLLMTPGAAHNLSSGTGAVLVLSLIHI